MILYYRGRAGRIRLYLRVRVYRYVCTYKTTTGSSKIINVISGFSIQQQRFYTILFCRQSMFRGYSDMQLSIIYTCNNSLRPHDVVLYYLVRITSLLLCAHIYKKGCGHTKKYQEKKKLKEKTHYTYLNTDATSTLNLYTHFFVLYLCIYVHLTPIYIYI